MKPEFVAALHSQAQHLLAGLAGRVDDIFPEGGNTELMVTGFIFRPATDDDFEEGEEDENTDDMYVYEAHFMAENHEIVGNLSSKLMIQFEGCDSYTAAIDRFIEEVGNITPITSIDNN